MASKNRLSPGNKPQASPKKKDSPARSTRLTKDDVENLELSPFRRQLFRPECFPTRERSSGIEDAILIDIDSDSSSPIEDTVRDFNCLSDALRRMGICGLALINRCSRKPKECLICVPQPMPNDYGVLEEEEEINIELSERIKDSMVIKFLLASHEMDSAQQLLVTKDMDCRTVIRSLGNPVKHLSSATFSISEHWAEFGAERIVEEHELILEAHHRNMKSGHHFTFAYIRNIEKYPTLSRKWQYFIDPKGAEDDIARLPPNVDPNFILIDDPYFTQHCPTSARLVLQGLRDPPEKETDSAEEEEEGFFPYAVPVPSTSRDIEVSTSESDDRAGSRFCVDQTSEPRERNSEEELDEDVVNPTYCGTVFVKQGDQELTLAEVRKLPGERLLAKWSEKYLLLRNRKLYFVDTHENMVLCYIMKHEDFAELVSYTCSKTGKGKLGAKLGRFRDDDKSGSSGSVQGTRRVGNMVD